ncbi:hypothetical protein TRVL_06310 [Trypanosoma vivax]|nr:hypothetical protein TRVL_06310 [Trypanosoma vivax]
MFLRTGFFLRSGSACGLRLKLSHLRAVRRTAVHQIIRRRSRTVHMKKPGSGYSPFLSRETSTIDDLLPRNDLLESAIALTISENRDARTELEFVRHFIAGNFLSLASPVGPWDPYDTKPQIFALDKYIALPVFTSLDYLRLFCKRFKFTVRDPSGMLWADGPGDAAREEKVCTDACRLPFPDTSERLWCDYRTRQHSDCTEADSLGPPTVLHELGAAIDCSSSASAVCGGSYDVQTSFLEASDLFGTMEPVSQGTCSVQHVSESGRMEESMITSKRSRKKVSKKRRVGRFVTGSRRVKARCGVAPSLNDESTSKDRYSDCKAHDLFWAKVRATAPFGITQAAPLPVFGPLVRPFFVGYFADTDTLLHNASIAPEKVDIILNPASPIEFVLGREATDRVLHRDQLLLLAYRRVERELRGEFHRFLSLFAPEVLWARSACVPCPVSGKANEVKYELVILIQSEDINQTFLRFRAAKNRCQLMGHADLDVLPWDTAAPHVREASTLFYERMNIACAVNNGLGGVLGIYEQRGPVQTVNVGISADSYYHDPRALYTESHAVFTEELKVSRSVPLQCGPDTSAGEPRR